MTVEWDHSFLGPDITIAQIAALLSGIGEEAKELGVRVHLVDIAQPGETVGVVVAPPAPAPSSARRNSVVGGGGGDTARRNSIIGGAGAGAGGGTETARRNSIIGGAAAAAAAATTAAAALNTGRRGSVVGGATTGRRGSVIGSSADAAAAEDTNLSNLPLPVLPSTSAAKFYPIPSSQARKPPHHTALISPLWHSLAFNYSRDGKTHAQNLLAAYQNEQDIKKLLEAIIK